MRAKPWHVPVVLFVVALALAALPFVADVARAGSLQVTEAGFGTAMTDQGLAGRGDRFTEGDLVIFYTRVVGASAGDFVDHVWKREGREMGRLRLLIGGSPWRAWSKLPLYDGSAGTWKVEARAPDGKVLATGTFTCVTRR